MFKRILVPVDGTESSDQVVHASVDLARQLGAAITCLLVEPALPANDEPRRGLPVVEESPQDPSEALAHAQDMLQRFDHCARAAGVAFSALREPGSHSDKALVAAAESSGCDLMVMVTTGRGVFGEALFDSQTKAVLAGCRLPLLLVPQ